MQMPRREVLKMQMSDEEFHRNQERLASRRATRRQRRRRALTLKDGFSENKRAIDSGEKFRAGGPKPTQWTASRTFEAKFSDTCPRCSGGIEPGDRVRYVDDVLVHARHSPKPEPKYEICDKCWLTRPCECE